MKKYSIALSFLSCLFFAINTYAGTDPIGWSVSPSTGLPAQTTMGSSYVVTYTLSNNLPFAVPLTVNSSHTGGSFYLTNRCNKTLAAKNQANSSCLVHVVFQPIKAGVNTAQLTMAYHNNRVPLTKLLSTASSVVSVNKIDGHVTTPLPGVTYTGNSYSVAFTFVNNGTSAVTATSVAVSGFNASGNTCTSALNPGSTCNVTGTFTPVSMGNATLGVTYTYNNGSSVSVPLTTQTDVQSSSGCHHVDAYSALPLPVSTYQYSDHVVQYVFTNHCNASSETLGTVNLSSDGSATLTKGTDTCSGATLAANTSCNVFVSVIPNTVTSNLAVTASVPYSGSTVVASAVTSEAVNSIPNPSTSHTVMFVNQCNQNVWYEFQNGIGGSGTTRKSPDPTPSGQNTFPDYQINQQLTGAAPAIKILNVNEYINGAIYGRTGCNASTGICQTANCSVIAGTATCQPGVAPPNPTTIFETTMSSAPASDGVYDVSIINGFNLPGQVKSLAALGSDTFGCGQSAGAIIQPTSALGICPWTFTLPTGGVDAAPNYTWVTGGADDACTSTGASCSGTNVCGTAFSSTTSGTAPINRRCGAFLGYWTVADYVGYTSNTQWGSVNLYSTYSLGVTLPAGPNGAYGNFGGVPAMYSALYGCQITDNGSLNSGYGYTQNVCGCYNWNQSGSLVPTAQSSNCTGSNSDWLTTVFPRISWLKQACPTAYSYQFDDKSVSFTCNQTNIKTSYQITYCPGGKTGAPA